MVPADALPEAIHYLATARDLGDERADDVEPEHARACRGVCELEDMGEGVEFLDEVLVFVGGAGAGAEGLGYAKGEVDGSNDVAKGAE